VSVLPWLSCVGHCDALISQAAEAVLDGQGALVELFERIGNVLSRLEIYTDVSPTVEMTEITVKLMVEVLSILAIATREIERAKASECISRDGRLLLTYPRSGAFLGNLVGRTDVADALLQLDRLTQEEVPIVVAKILRAADSVHNELTAVSSNVCGVDRRLEGVENRVKGVERKVNRVLNSARLIFNWSSTRPNTLHISNPTNSKRLWRSGLYVISSVLPKVVKAQAIVQGTQRERTLENGSLLQILP
jgi:hypothetical protein